MKKIIILFIAYLLSTHISFSQSVQIDSIYSRILKKAVPTTIILPSGYDTAKQYPVFYLLHWWSGNNESFLKTNLLGELKKAQVIVVTPSADTSWYVNSVTDSPGRYEDFMALELFNYIDKKYKTDASRQAIGGFSMGGFGALQIGLKHPERFKFIANISGAINAPFYDVPLTPGSPLNFIMNSVKLSFGDANSNTSAGSNVFALVKSISHTQNVFVYIAVGKQDEFDFIIPQNKKLVEELKRKKVDYQYSEFDGGHFDGKVIEACFPSLFNVLTQRMK